MSNSQEAIQFLLGAQADPVKVIINGIFDEYPWEKQAEIIQAVFDHPRVTVKSCHGIGKTWLAARVAMAFLIAHPNSIVVTTAPTFRQVQNQIWREIHVAHKRSKFDLGGQLTKIQYDLGEKWYALGVSSDKPTNVQGFHAEHLLIICDEAAGIPPLILEAIEGSLTSASTRLLMIGNPTISYGGFYDSHQSNLYKKFSISVFDTPNFKINGIKSTADLRKFKEQEDLMSLPLENPHLVTPLWAWTRLHAWGEDSPMYRARVEAIFPEESENTLFPLDKIEQAIHRVAPEHDREERMAVGIDVARYGSDTTVITAVHGTEVKEMYWHEGKDLMETTGEAIRIFNELGMRKSQDLFAVDDTGVGGGVSDRLIELGYRVARINFGSKSTDDRFTNLKAQLFWHAKDLFSNGEVTILDKGKLVAQLSTVRYNYTSQGKLEIVSKDKMKKEGFGSPDFPDSLAIALWASYTGDSDPFISKEEDDDWRPVAGNLLSERF